MDQNQEQQTDNSSNKQTILVVEDESLLGNLLEKKLVKEGFNVLRAENGLKAIEILKENTVDLILLDVILPKASGFDFMKEKQENPELQNLPTVIVSNLGQKSDIEKGKNLGAIGYFVKAHMSIEDLVKQVKDFLSNKN